MILVGGDGPDQTFGPILHVLFSIATIATVGFLGGVLIIAIIKTFQTYHKQKELDERVQEAEKEAFISKITITQAAEDHVSSLEDVFLEVARSPATSLSEAARRESNENQAQRLFNLYNRQIESYQNQTQSQANYSFVFAVCAMITGLIFMAVGGAAAIINGDLAHSAPAGVVATIGAAAGTYIAKTFLDVHRLSLVQLNHYFRQPVLNAHILTALRIANEIEDISVREKAYESILEKVTTLITEKTGQQPVRTISTGAKKVRSPK